MSALSFRRIVLLALVFVTAARAAGPTPTSVEDSEMNIHARDGGSPYGVRSGSNHDRNGGYPNSKGYTNSKDDRDRGWSNGGWNYAHNYGYNGGGNNNGGSNNHGGGGDKGWGNDQNKGGGGKVDNHGGKGNDGWGNSGGSNHGGDKNHEDWQNGGGGNDWGNGGGWGGNDGGWGGNGGGWGSTDGGWGGKDGGWGEKDGGWGGKDGGWGGSGGGGADGGHGGGGGGHGDGGNHGGGGEYWPQPSQFPKQRLATKPMESMSPSELADTICPSDLSACPIAEPGTLSSLPTSVSEWADRGFECVDLKADLRACGGCPSLDSKYDCTTIEGAEQIACVTGQCVVDSCRAGYQLDSNKNACHRQ